MITLRGEDFIIILAEKAKVLASVGDIFLTGIASAPNGLVLTLADCGNMKMLFVSSSELINYKTKRGRKIPWVVTGHVHDINFPKKQILETRKSHCEWMDLEFVIRFSSNLCL
jgi:methanogenic corrinoid protein MtbC1